MGFTQSIVETIKKRQSIRTYATTPITADDYKKITDYINDEDNLIGPFSQKGRIELVQVTNNMTDKGIKLGTYGFIKNPQAYLVGKTENNQISLLDFGYIFQKMVLHLTEMELGTCWMGGTFNRHSFEKELDLREGQFIPCITPIGYPANKQRVFDKAVRIVVKADNKKAWDKMFYDSSFSNVLKKEHAGLLELPIEMVRLGPSASNKQPWRLVLSEDQRVCHFYIEHTPNYSTKLGYDMQLLDMGIAMCQFDVACKELNIHGNWVINDPQLDLLNEHTEYLFSWQMES